MYSDDFEGFTSDWNVSGDAVDGIWELGEPNGTFYGVVPVAPDDDATENGIRCFITGNSAPQNTPSDDDVDGGITILTSPVIDLSEETQVMLSYYRWFTNNLGDNPSTDSWIVAVSDDAGNNWVDLENTIISDNSWSKKLFFLEDYINLTSSVQLRFSAEDVFHDGEFGSGGSIVEAALDEINFFSIGNQTEILLGDVNFDGSVDVLDAVLVINFVLSFTEPTPDEYTASDVNIDGVIDILDIVLIINLILD